MRGFLWPVFRAVLFVWLGAVLLTAGGRAAPSAPETVSDAALTPQPGEVRLEGTLRETFPTQGRVLLLAIRAQDPGRRAQRIDPPRPKVILVGPATMLRPGSGGPPSLNAFLPGDSVIVVGKSQGRGRPLAARVIAAQ